ncbi:toxin co-regulated pilus biosynthesis Q family protein [Pseudoalteromonas sp. S558]|uniref:toxin co-regulated pilus biosynthesis Q family protein n=1 Tax=Pseudoalteromonas sp. S558 TaxID=2066515 RepID=UPI00110B5A8D|nr:toxin co-regulated pilus biosynthesis Q family protein [Pseudoalteromonas sp. S558]TMO10482.1 hypothetical protein CWB66_00450 [Pseudoalteromonas sp. S558]
MWFWLKHLSVAVLLIIFALYFLLGDGLVLDFKHSKNAAAEGLSRFYASIQNKSKNDKERGNFVLKLAAPEQTLDRVLTERTRIVDPMPTNWAGKIEPRRFESGTTLKEALSEFAENEGITLYWYLDKDFVVKDYFRVDNDFTSTFYQIGRAINDEFEYEVYTYFCHKQRAAIITEKPSEFVRANCVKINV